MPTLADAIILAVNAHRDQKDKAGQPYYLHPIRAMTRVHTETEKFVALLHDVLEDTNYTADDLRSMGYSEDILSALDFLTRRQDETYEAFIERIMPNPIARQVKLADLEDNMDLTRLCEVPTSHLHLLDRYVKAWHTLASYHSR